MTPVPRSDSTDDDSLRLVVDIPERGLVTVTATGELNRATARQFELTARQHLVGHLPYLLTLDLTGVMLFSWAGVFALLRINDVTRKLAATMHLIATDVVLRPLRRLDRHRELTITSRPRPAALPSPRDGGDRKPVTAVPDWWSPARSQRRSRPRRLERELTPLTSTLDSERGQWLAGDPA